MIETNNTAKHGIPIAETVRYAPEEASAVSGEPLGQPLSGKAVEDIVENHLSQWWNPLVTDCAALPVDDCRSCVMNGSERRFCVDWTDEKWKGKEWTTEVRVEAEPGGAVVFRLSHAPRKALWEEEGAG